LAAVQNCCPFVLGKGEDKSVSRVPSGSKSVAVIKSLGKEGRLWNGQLCRTGHQRVKRIFVNTLKTQKLLRQKAEAWARAITVNQITNLGMPVSVKI